MAQKSCVGAVPALLWAERDQRNPVIVEGNVTAARIVVDVLPDPIAVCSTTTNCLSIGRRAARMLPPVLARFLDDIVSRGTKETREFGRTGLIYIVKGHQRFKAKKMPLNSRSRDFLESREPR